MGLGNGLPSRSFRSAAAYWRSASCAARGLNNALIPNSGEVFDHQCGHMLRTSCTFPHSICLMVCTVHLHPERMAAEGSKRTQAASEHNNLLVLASPAESVEHLVDAIV